MEIVIKKEKPVFSSGISYEEHQIKVTQIYESVVKPQIEARKNNNQIKTELSAIQKATISCKSPI